MLPIRERTILDSSTARRNWLRIATEFGDHRLRRRTLRRRPGDARITGHLFYPYFIEALKDGLKAAVAASELGAALSALMHYSKYSNINTFDLHELNKLIARSMDKVERGESRATNLHDTPLENEYWTKCVADSL